MDFSDALRAVKDGKRIARAGWNGKNMSVYYVEQIGSCLPFLSMVTAQGDLVPWLASQTDLLAQDWEVL